VFHCKYCSLLYICKSVQYATVTDIVALIGDLTDGSVKRNGDAAASLKSMKAHIGKYFVSGMQ